MQPAAHDRRTVPPAVVVRKRRAAPRRRERSVAGQPPHLAGFGIDGGDGTEIGRDEHGPLGAHDRRGMNAAPQHAAERVRTQLPPPKNRARARVGGDNDQRRLLPDNRRADEHVSARSRDGIDQHLRPGRALGAPRRVVPDDARNAPDTPPGIRSQSNQLARDERIYAAAAHRRPQHRVGAITAAGPCRTFGIAPEELASRHVGRADPTARLHKDLAAGDNGVRDPRHVHPLRSQAGGHLRVDVGVLDAKRPAPRPDLAQAGGQDVRAPALPGKRRANRSQLGFERRAARQLRREHERALGRPQLAALDAQVREHGKRASPDGRRSVQPRGLRQTPNIPCQPRRFEKLRRRSVVSGPICADPCLGPHEDEAAHLFSERDVDAAARIEQLPAARFDVPLGCLDGLRPVFRTGERGQICKRLGCVVGHVDIECMTPHGRNVPRGGRSLEQQHDAEVGETGGFHDEEPLLILLHSSPVPFRCQTRPRPPAAARHRQERNVEQIL